MSKFRLDCDKANHICDKNQYKEATLSEKIVLTIHLIYCRACQKYTTRNSKLTKLIKNQKVHTLDNAAKTNLQHAFDAELAKQQQN